MERIVIVSQNALGANITHVKKGNEKGEKPERKKTAQVHKQSLRISAFIVQPEPTHYANAGTDQNI